MDGKALRRAILVTAVASALMAITPLGAAAGAKPPPPGTPPPEITPPPPLGKPPVVIKLDVLPPCIDVDSHGVVPTVLYGDAVFNVEEIAPATVRLAGAAPDSTSLADKNEDGYLDLLARFPRPALKLPPDATQVIVTGLLKDGQAFVGSDAIGPCGKGAGQAP
jgi:hypothetical protein